MATAHQPRLDPFLDHEFYCGLGSNSNRVFDMSLLLNRNADKAEVIHNKMILWYCFVEKFDVSPFSSMVLSVLPEEMSQIEEDNRSLICNINIIAVHA
jgi:hypothetical protein